MLLYEFWNFWWILNKTEIFLGQNFLQAPCEKNYFRNVSLLSPRNLCYLEGKKQTPQLFTILCDKETYYIIFRKKHSTSVWYFCFWPCPVSIIYCTLLLRVFHSVFTMQHNRLWWKPKVVYEHFSIFSHNIYEGELFKRGIKHFYRISKFRYFQIFCTIIQHINKRLNQKICFSSCETWDVRRIRLSIVHISLTTNAYNILFLISWD